MAEPDDIESMPGVFTTLTEAEKFQNSILKLLLCFISKGQQPISRAGGSTRTYPVYVFSEPIPPPILHEKETLRENVCR
jgi:hypothetical protein